MTTKKKESKATKKPSISDATWTDVIRRFIVMGESASALAREIGVTEGAVRSRASTKRYEVKQLANQMVEVERKYNTYDRSTKTLIDDMAAQLRAVSSNLTRAAISSSDTSAKLSLIVNKQVSKINPEDPLESEDILKAISGMTKMANDASVIGIALINASHKAPRETDEANDLAGALNNFIAEMPN